MKIVDLTVTVTYTVSLSNVRVSDEAYFQLMENIEFNDSDRENNEAYDWLANNIDQTDAQSCNYEVEEIEDVDEDE